MLCSDFSEHTRPPRSAGDGPPGPRQALASSPAATCRYGRQVSPFPRPVRATVRTRAKRGCRLEPRSASPGRTRNTLVRASPDANYRDRVTPRNPTHLINYSLFYFIFVFFSFYYYLITLYRFKDLIVLSLVLLVRIILFHLIQILFLSCSPPTLSLRQLSPVRGALE